MTSGQPSTPTRDLVKTTVFLFAGLKYEPIGTGFIVGFQYSDQPNQRVPLIVTAKHVIASHDRFYVRFSGKSGGEMFSVTFKNEELRSTGRMWEHPDEGVDLVAFITFHARDFDTLSIPVSGLASKSDFSDADIKPTDRVVFPCLLTNFMGQGRNYPVVRNGYIALVPDEPVPLEYDVAGKHIITQQEMILIDATATPGASGSPIFLWPDLRLKGEKYQLWGERLWLLGIIHGFYPTAPQEIVHIIQSTKLVPAYAENSGIALVFPSWRIRELLELPEVLQGARNYAQDSYRQE